MLSTSAILSRSFVVWLIIIAAETINGIVREILISPIVGGQAGRQISFGIAIVLITAITLIFVRWIGAFDIWRLVGVGLLWAFLTFVFEVAASRILAGRSWAETMADFDPASGGLMAFGLAFLAIIPVLASSVLGFIRPEVRAR